MLLSQLKLLIRPGYLMKHSLDAAALEAAGHDQTLNLGSAFPDAVDAELTPEALGDVRAGVAAAAKNL